jgi:hypothetical protein
MPIRSKADRPKTQRKLKARPCGPARLAAAPFSFGDAFISDTFISDCCAASGRRVILDIGLKRLSPVGGCPANGRSPFISASFQLEGILIPLLAVQPGAAQSCWAKHTRVFISAGF